MEEKKCHSLRNWLIGLVLLSPILYVLSFGPACWLTAIPSVRDRIGSVMIIYIPLTTTAYDDDIGWRGKALRWWVMLGVHPGSKVILPRTISENAKVGFNHQW